MPRVSELLGVPAVDPPLGQASTNDTTVYYNTAAIGEVAESKGSRWAIRARLLTALAGGGLLTVLFEALSTDYGLTVGDATQKFLILIAALVFGYSHVDHKSPGE